MKRLAIMALVTAVCAGCTTAEKYKSVSVETDGSGKVIRRVENESVKQTDSANKKLEFKHIQL
jgi:hypothetical protein